MRQLGDKVYALMDQLRQHQAGVCFVRHLVSVFEGRGSCMVIPTHNDRAVFVATTFSSALGEGGLTGA